MHEKVMQLNYKKAYNVQFFHIIQTFLRNFSR